jgi:hypothetical protein
MSSDIASVTLSSLAQRLEASGMVVVRFKDYIEVRLPVFASVRVRLVDGRLIFDPRFGPLPRDRVAWITLLGFATVVASAFLRFGVTPISVMLGFLSVSSGASTAIRYQLTETCITRVITAFEFMKAEMPMSLAAPEIRGELREPSAAMQSTPRDYARVRRNED